MPATELFQILAEAKAQFRENVDILDRTKGLWLVEATNLRDNVWHNITPFCKSINVSHNDDGHSTCNIVLNNRHFELTGRGLITENFSVRIYMGYRDIGLIYQGQFVIDTPTPNFPDKEFPTISLSGKDMLIEASDNEEIQVYDSGTNDEVARKIAFRHGWEYEDNFGHYDKHRNYHEDNHDYFYKDEKWNRFAKEGHAHSSRIRSSVSEYAFMKDMAIESGNVLYMESRYDMAKSKLVNRLHFHKPKPRTNLLELWYRCPYNPLLNNIINMTPGEVTYKRAQSVSTGGIDLNSGSEVFETSRGKRTPLDRRMINDEFENGKDPYDYRQYDTDTGKGWFTDGDKSGEQGTAGGAGSYAQRRAIYESISAINRGRILDGGRRKYRHIPHLLKQNTTANASDVVESIDAAGHFVIECTINCIYGLPRVKQTDLMRLRGAKFYDGLYYIKSVSHSVGEKEPLRTSLVARGNSTWGIKSATNYDNEGDHYSYREEGEYEEDDFQDPDENENNGAGGGYGKGNPYNYSEMGGFYYDFYGGR